MKYMIGYNMLIIFEMANNHQGDVELGKRIIREFSEVAKVFPQFDYAFKFQYRDLPTFIHPSADPEDKYVKRFRETNLSREHRRELKNEAARLGFWTACTPFDEESVDHVVEDGYDILKVGSPSFKDWLLWNKIVMAWNGPVIASCGGANEEEIDRIACMYMDEDLTLMHCVSEYPTKYDNLQFGQIVYLKNTYPAVKVGLSLHAPFGFDYGDYAAALRVDAIERHVYAGEFINDYSVSPSEMFYELKCLTESIEAFGVLDKRVPGPKPTQFMRRMIDGRMWWKP